MAWTIPNLVLHDKPVRLANMRTHGRRHVFVNCGNPDCYHNAELDVSGLPDNLTFGEVQRRMLCTVCDHRGADVSPPWLSVAPNLGADDDLFCREDKKNGSVKEPFSFSSPNDDGAA